MTKRTLGLLLLLTGTLAGSVPVEGQQPLPEGRLIFVHEETGSTDPVRSITNLWTLDVADPTRPTALTRLNTPAALANSPVLSRDRRRVAFISNMNLLGSLEATSVFIMNTDGTGLRQVTGFGTLEPMPGPTGTITGRVQPELFGGAGTPSIGSCIVSAPGTPNAASCGPDGTFTLQNVPVGATFVRVQASVHYSNINLSPGLSFGSATITVREGQVTNVGTIPIRPVYSRSLEPSWSPDGTRILVTNEVTSSSLQANRTTGVPEFRTGSVQHLAIWRVDGSYEGTVSIPGAPQFSLSGADWSPVEDRIACAVNGGNLGESYVALLRPDGSQAQGIFQVPVDLVSIRLVNQCRWSPDGRRIAFVMLTLAGDLTAAWSDLYVINRDGTGLQQITGNDPGFYIISPTWATDGQAIAFGFERRRDLITTEWSDLFIKPLTRTGFIQLTDDGRSYQPAW